MPDATNAISREKLSAWLLERMGELHRDRHHAVKSTSYTTAGILDARHAQLYELMSHLGAGDLDA